MPIFCTACGTQQADNATFCTNCGAAIAPGAPPPGASAPPQPLGTGAPASGLSDNAAGAIAYCTIIPAILFLVMEPYSRKRFVRFHAFQCLFLAAVWLAMHVVMIFIPFGFGFGLALHMVWRLVIFVAWLVALIKASQGQIFKLPIIGDLAEQQAGPGA